LNFNYKIALLPAHLVDYIIVHELCHLGQMNHSAKFWELVSKTTPNYLALRKELLQKYPLPRL
jgi:predicted metal-dependent hydrolase